MDNKSIVLDIAMNLNRVGNWAADGYEERKKKIGIFLDNTNGYLKNLDESKFSDSFKDIFNKFKVVYKKLEKQGREGPKDTLYWAEMMMTWGNILTHRSKLI